MNYVAHINGSVLRRASAGLACAVCGGSAEGRREASPVVLDAMVGCEPIARVGAECGVRKYRGPQQQSRGDGVCVLGQVHRCRR
jgi:hypothetical protein